MQKKIKELLKEYLDIVYSKENERNKQYWSEIYNWNRDMWRGIPRTKGGVVPFTIAPDNSLWSQILNINLIDFYNDPELFLEAQLKMKIFHFNNFKDNTYFTKELFIWFGVITEISFFDTDIVFYSNKEPWIKSNILNTDESFSKINIPNFYNSGLMPKIHKYYETIRDYVDNIDSEINVMFPEWVRGPFCIATHLRGMENILMDMILNPNFVHKLMKIIVKAQKKWNLERDKFLGTKTNRLKLFNDEINFPTLSPDMYREFIFPYEQELAQYFGEVTYWHSCGLTDDFMYQINKLTNLHMFHCGPWSSYKKATSIFGKKVALDICLNPQKDILDADNNQIINKLNDIISSCENKNFTIRADGFMRSNNLNYTIKKITQWNKTAQKQLS